MKFFGVLIDNRRQRKAKYFRLPQSEEEDLTETFNQELANFLDREPKAFDPGYKREDDEVYTVQPFNVPEFLTYAAGNWHSCGDVRRGEVKPQAVKAIVGIEGRGVGTGESPVVETAAFKVLDRSKVFDASRRVLEWNQDTFVRRNNPSVVVPEGLDAVYTDETLHFDTFRTTNSLLDLSQAFEELTNEAIESVLEEVQWLSYEDEEVPLNKVLNQTNRRLFSIINATEDFSSIDLQVIKDKALDLGFPLQTSGDGDEETIVLPSVSGEMKSCLEFLLQRFYPGIFDGRLRRANSSEIIRN